MPRRRRTRSRATSARSSLCGTCSTSPPKAAEAAGRSSSTMIAADSRGRGHAPIESFNRRDVMSYVEGFILAVPAENKDEYRRHAAAAWPIFAEFGATRLVEAWEDDVADG